jgi:hypothetical protein
MASLSMGKALSQKQNKNKNERARGHKSSGRLRPLVSPVPSHKKGIKQG